MSKDSKVEQKSETIVPDIKIKKMNASVNLPRTLNLSASNLSEEWKKWLLNFKIFNIASGNDSLSQEQQCMIFLNLVGEEAISVFDTFEFETDSDKNHLQKLIDKFESYCNPKRTTTYERYVFFSRKQKPAESVTEYITELRKLASSCEFKDLKDSLIKDCFILGMTNVHMREVLLCKNSDLSLDEVIQMCRSAELSHTQASAIGGGDSEQVIVEESKQKRVPQQRPDSRPHGSTSGRQPAGQQFKKSNDPCQNCGYIHGNRRCPALGQTCRGCGKKNHFSKVCRSVSRVQEVATVGDDDYFYVECTNEPNKGGRWFQTVLVNNVPVT